MTSKFSSIEGFFIQDDPTAIPSVIGPLPPRLGLRDDTTDRWKTLEGRLAELNASNHGEAAYKLVYLCRHGQGFHNVAEAKYGTEAWDAYWSTLNGDDELTWGTDPLLTPLGKVQALDARKAFPAENSAGILLPQRCYASPLKRALDTWRITFNGDGEGGEGVLEEEKRKVLVLENCREEYGIHTCDLRSPLSSLRALYPPPTYTFESSFTEDHPVWRKDERETKEDTDSCCSNDYLSLWFFRRLPSQA
ncbi:hypothetical protein EIP91_004018 [Steccherinum ochraceum]|uniref:Phosphoglycerate mutase-like protein n=1 Tax=Steccherinum ochraceum TaxID=92696 RepID=A0A4R0R9J2_9APHY|nr:hypothetical protein EIP91_004018 [Steccherinum ochraceum]